MIYCPGFHCHAAEAKLVIGGSTREALLGALQANRPGCEEEGLHVRFEIQRALILKDERYELEVAIVWG